MFTSPLARATGSLLVAFASLALVAAPALADAPAPATARTYHLGLEPLRPLGVDDLSPDAEPEADAEAADDLAYHYRYQPTRPAPHQHAMQSVNGGPAPGPSAFAWGLGIDLGYGMPIGGDLHDGTGQREFTPTGSLGLHIPFELGGIIQIAPGFRVGLGGLQTDAYESRYRTGSLYSRNAFVGVRARFMPRSYGTPRLFVSALAGADRVAAARSEPTGWEVCGPISCSREYEETFAAGYWGSTFGVGGGVRFDSFTWPRFAVLVEANYFWTHYGTYTVTGQESFDLSDDLAPDVHGVLFTLSVQSLFDR